MKGLDESAKICQVSQVFPCFLFLTEVSCVGEVWKAAGQDAQTEYREQEREETQCPAKSIEANARQVGEQEEEVCEQDLDRHCARWVGGRAKAYY